MRVACVGAGRMGRGMAHAFAYAGHEIVLIDAKSRTPDAFAVLAAEAMAEVAGSLYLLADLGALSQAQIAPILARVSVQPREQAQKALAGMRFIFEGVPETRAAKAAALAFIDAHADEEAIVASTTSTFLSTDLATMTQRPARFLNAHWLNPAYLVPLVEVSPHAGTLPELTAELVSMLESIGKVPVICRASPGYIVPRIQMLALNEAARLVVASAEDIDRAVKYGFGLRFAVLGLLEFIDWGGGDILAYASRYMTEATGQDRFKAPDVVDANMAAGRIGMKSGEGFYDWRNRDVDAVRRDRLGAFVTLLRQMGAFRAPVI